VDSDGNVSDDAMELGEQAHPAADDDDDYNDE
jgi:hypothetical protein